MEIVIVMDCHGGFGKPSVWLDIECPATADAVLAAIHQFVPLIWWKKSLLGDVEYRSRSTGSSSTGAG